MDTNKTTKQYKRVVRAYDLWHGKAARTSNGLRWETPESVSAEFLNDGERYPTTSMLNRNRTADMTEGRTTLIALTELESWIEMQTGERALGCLEGLVIYLVEVDRDGAILRDEKLQPVYLRPYGMTFSCTCRAKRKN